MALWQFSFELVPLSAAEKLHDLGTSAFDDIDAVPELSADTVERFMSSIPGILQRSVSLSKMIEVWGDEGGVTLQRWQPGGIRVRINVSNYGPPLAAKLGELLDAAQKQRVLLLLLDDLQLLEPQLSLVEKAMARSHAAQWICNPSSLSNIHRNSPDQV